MPNKRATWKNHRLYPQEEIQGSRTEEPKKNLKLQFYRTPLKNSDRGHSEEAAAAEDNKEAQEL